MTIKDLIQQTRIEFNKILDFFSRELLKIRTGQASPALVEDVVVDVFSQKMPLKQLAGISCPERRQILIQPWDPSYMDAIAKALQKTDMGSSPIVEKNAIRINLPPLTQEYRDQLIKVLSEKGEQVRQGFRKQREETWGKIQDAVKDGELREDDKFRGKEELQKLIDECQLKLEEMIERKKQEISL